MKLSNSKLLSVTIAVVGFLWCFAMIAVTSLMTPPWPFVGGVLFGLLAVVVSILYLTVFRHSPGIQAAENGAITIYLTISYVLASLGCNTAYILTRHGAFSRFLILSNLAIIAVYCVAILFAEKDAKRLSEQLSRTERKTAGPGYLSAKLGVLLSLTEDKELHGRLLKLKESVDYSSNITTDATLASEKQMAALLDELQTMIADQADASEIQQKLREAETEWKTRANIAAIRK